MINSHPTLLPINPNTRSTKTDSVLEADEHQLYQSIIGSGMYLVTCLKPDLAYPIFYVLQFFPTPFESQLTAARRLLPYINSTKDIELSLPNSHSSLITLERYSDPDYRNCLDTWQSISSNLFRLNNSIIYLHSKKQKSVVISLCELDCMTLAIATKQWISLRHPL
jgi:hypothetical protein